ncbi:hypothetical protein J4466_03370 [Candidatus Pacearchaeota archaeon]|nr:hypothetical protein [Candidatus Pacearchaeota archaeon]
MKILLDTNFILTCTKQKIDLFSELKKEFGNTAIIIPQQVLDELNKLLIKKSLNTTEKTAAKLSLDLIKKNLVFIIDIKTKNVDLGVAKYLNSNNDESFYLATLDRNLKKRIKNQKTKFLTIRNKKRIEIQDKNY